MLMRAEVIKFVLAQCSTVPPMWNVEQAVQLLQYCDSCWFLPDNIRQSWIDERRLRVMGLGGTQAAITSTSGVLARHLNISTGPPENSHKLLDDLFMRLQLNRDVMTVAVRVSGKDAHGRDGVGVFDYEMKRLADSRGTVPKESVDLRLSTARAALQLLRLLAAGNLDEKVELHDAATAFVHKFGDERLLRHAEPGDSGVRCFPWALKAMKSVLKHAGPLSFSRADDGFYTVDRYTGRCDCDASHYHGVTSAVGTCKHARLASWVAEYKSGPSGAEAVVKAAQRALYTLVHERERSKPASMRCGPLYSAANAGAVVELLDEHVSVPPTGKSTGLDDALRSVAPPIREEMQFSVAAQPDASFPHHDLGLLFVPVEFEDEALEGGRSLLELRVASYSRRASGGVGPGDHTGDTIRPGDVVFAVNGDAELPLPKLQADQTLALPTYKPATLHFYRSTPTPGREEEGAGPSAGGRPAARQAKYPAAGGRQPSALGGAPARRGRKPQALPARLHSQVEVGVGGLRRQVSQVSDQLLGAGYMESEIARLSDLAATDTYVP